jgi:AhpD family alkylhydroperoxidase
MRLSILDNGHRLRTKLFLKATARMSRVDNPDIVKMLLYRPDFFTRPLLDLTAPAMRGDSYWTPGEREYLAMSIARMYQCEFCLVSHAELTRLAAHGEIDPDNPASARPELQAVLEFLEKPGQVPDLPKSALQEALHVGVVWNIVNRLALAFGFELREGQLHSGTRALHRFGYRFPGFLLSGGERIDRGDLVENLRYAVFENPAVTSPEQRKAAARGEQPYTSKVRDTPNRVTDGDIEQLTATGHTEDEIFEITAAAAIGAALDSYDAGVSRLGS